MRKTEALGLMIQHPGWWTMQALAKALGARPATAGNLLLKLKRQGLVKRAHDPSRHLIYEINAAGKDRYEYLVWCEQQAAIATAAESDEVEDYEAEEIQDEDEGVPLPYLSNAQVVAPLPVPPDLDEFEDDEDEFENQ